MDIFNTKKIGDLNNRIEELTGQLKQYQTFLIDDVLTARAEDAKTYRGNEYRNYTNAVKEISNKGSIPDRQHH